MDWIWPAPLSRVTIAFVAIALVSCDNNAKSQTKSAPPVEVTVITVKPHDVPRTDELPGRTTAFAVAEIRPQVGGIVLKRQFVEGSDVKAGQVLYRIDPSEARADVANAQATLASAQASLASAREKSVRYTELVEIEAVSRESVDEAKAAFKQAQAQVAAALASLASARLSLSYADVKSPIDGRIGRSSVSQGALVTAGQTTALATVLQLDPIYVDATQSATEMLRVRRDFAEGRLIIEDGGRPIVRLILEDGSVYAHTGELLLAEAIVEPTAGSVTLRAQFPNPKRQLLPGMYVRMKFEGAITSDALTVPQVAVTRDAKGNALVFVVDSNNKVEQRVLVANEAAGDAWIVDSGLKAGERVIIEGLQKVRAGMTVRVSAPARMSTATGR